MAMASDGRMAKERKKDERETAVANGDAGLSK